ncbi:ubiquitin-like FUBI-ribosomal protein eS30 fusion protein [Artemia franciscana]|uniref:ubiquitin-like FUBI-ribosomal protein eS30 fusion protein n=1 Tax=Artemia franciscana TaxID=6661 RepID=UPI0032D9F8EB
MQIHLRGSDSSTHVINCNEGDSVLAIKEQIAALEDVQVPEIRLFSSGVPLTNEMSLNGIQGTVDFSVPLLGGKVHGSLARAGKVKGQTPKVDKQEKKKKKTGRCKRRIQYNRRFVNVVATFGRKRGPNTNS